MKKKPEKEESLVKTVDLGRQWNSKLRIYLWNQLRRLYDAYVSSKTLSVNDQELRGLITAILGNVSEM